jgi:hypothetical protein
MSLKRSNSGGRGLGGGGGDAGGKVDRQELFDELKRLAASGGAFTPVDIALAIGAAEPTVSKSLLGLAAEGYLERVEGGQYRSTPMAEMSQAEFVKAYARASRVDSTRQRDLSEIGRLKQNNDVMRQRLLAAISERDHYLGLLKARGIDPGTPPTPSPAPPAVAGAPVATRRVDNPENEEAAPGAAGLAVPSPRSESEHMPSGPGDAGPADSNS